MRAVAAVGVERQHVGAERLGQHDGGVVLARLGPIDRVVLIGDHPVELLVPAELGEDLLADVHPDRDQVALVPGVGAGDGDLQVLGVRERVPAGDDVEPGEQGGDDDQAEQDDARHHVLGRVTHVAGRQVQDVLHARSSPSAGSSSAVGASSSGGAGRLPPRWRSLPPSARSRGIGLRFRFRVAGRLRLCFRIEPLREQCVGLGAGDRRLGGAPVIRLSGCDRGDRGDRCVPGRVERFLCRGWQNRCRAGGAGESELAQFGVVESSDLCAVLEAVLDVLDGHEEPDHEQYPEGPQSQQQRFRSGSAQVRTPRTTSPATPVSTVVFSSVG